MSLAWTHTMAYDDVRAMLLLAEPGDRTQEWQEKATRDSRLLSGSRRASQLRIATSIIRPVAGVIVEDGFLSDLRAADEQGAQDIIYARYLTSLPIAVAFARRFFHETDQSRRSERITRGDLKAFLQEIIPDLTDATKHRTRTAIGTQFQAAGIVQVERDGTLIRTGRRPAAVAVFHLLRDELAERREASDIWISINSIAADLFALDTQITADVIEELIADGRLQRSYYAGEPRVFAA